MTGQGVYLRFFHHSWPGEVATASGYRVVTLAAGLAHLPVTCNTREPILSP